MPGTFARYNPLRIYRDLRREFSPVVFVLAAGDLVASFGFSLIFPFLTMYLVSAFGATAFEAGLVISGYAVCSIVSGAAGGWLADRVGRRQVMIVSVAITGLVVVLMGQARDLVQIGLLTVVLGMIDPAFIPAARAAIADVVPEERRPRAYGLLAVAASVGWIAGPAIGAGLSRLGYPLLFGIAGVIIALYAVIAIRWLPETRPVAARPVAALPAPIPGADSTRASAGGPATGAAGADPPPPTLPPAAPAALRPSVVLAAFLPLAMLIHGTTFLWVTTLPIAAARELGITPDTWGLLFAINGTLICIFQLRVAGAAERHSKPRMMAIAAAVYGAGYAIAAVTTPALVIVGLAGVIVAMTVGEMLHYPLEAAFVSDLAPEDRRGRYQGAANAAGSLGAALAPPAAGWILDVQPGPTVWLLTAGTLALCAVGLLGLARLAARLPAGATRASTPIGGTPGVPDMAP